MNLYFDMDGVLADFNNEPDGINRFKTEKEQEKIIKDLKYLIFRKFLLQLHTF